MLAKSKLNGIEVLISKASIDSDISHDKIVLINNVLKEYADMKEEIKSLKSSSSFERSYVATISDRTSKLIKTFTMLITYLIA